MDWLLLDNSIALFRGFRMAKVLDILVKFIVLPSKDMSFLLQMVFIALEVFLANLTIV